MNAQQAAEQQAVQAIRRGLEDGLNLDQRALARIADTTGLTVAEVSALRDRLVSGRRPERPQAPPALRAVAPPSHAEGWRSAKDHPDRAIRDLYGKACAAVAALDAALGEYERTRELRERREQLEAELAKVREQLGDEPAFPCEQCGRLFTRAQALGTHRTRAHGGAA